MQMEIRNKWRPGLLLLETEREVPQSSAVVLRTAVRDSIHGRGHGRTDPRGFVVTQSLGSETA
jgi:hypothetical protein